MVLKHDTIEIITGCMFSGKTEELIRRVNSAKTRGLETKLFKPEIDKRYDTERIVSHSGISEESYAIEKSEDILKHLKNARVIGIDEVQFFDKGIIDLCIQLAKLNYRIILAGLDKDFLANDFGPMSHLIEISNNVTVLSAICNVCGDKAFYTFKKNNSIKLIEIGEKNIYEARCLSCYQNGMKGQIKADFL